MRGLVILLGAMTQNLLAGTVQAAPTSAAATQEPWAENDRAREQFRLGINAFRARRLDEARQLLTEAWRLRRTYDVAASLAQVENELGHRARAASLLDFCLNNFAPIESDTKFQQLRLAFDEVRSRVGQIDLTALPPGTEVRVDDELLGKTPLGMALYVEPGLHDFTLRVRDRMLKRSLSVQAGAEHRLEPELGREQPDGPTKAPVGQVLAEGAPQPNQSATSVGARPSFPYYVGAALFAAGAATAVVFQLAANAAHQRAEDLKAQPGATDCAQKGMTSSELCRGIADANADGVFDRNLAIFGYGLAATATVATAIYWLWPDANTTTKTAKPRATTWVIDAEPARVRVGISGSFP
jgi:hypothetical protein